jgi:hypothetical protein
MPVVFRHSGLRYYFFSNEISSRTKVSLQSRRMSIKGGGRDAKVWLEPELALADSYGFNPRELSNIIQVVAENRNLVLKAWHDHCGNQRSV